ISRIVYRWCGTFFAGPVVAGVGTARLVGFVSVLPCTLVKGALAANVGRLCARTCVTASKPDASLISVGSLKAVPKKLIPSGTPYCVQLAGCVVDAQSLGKPAGTCTIGYPPAAAMLEVPKMKWSPKSRSVAQAGLSVALTMASRCCAES